MGLFRRTQLYDAHVAAGATMANFCGWAMPLQYPDGIVAEHLFTRHACSMFDVSHMGRFLVEGPERTEFLQHVLSSNVMALDLNKVQYTIIPNESGGIVDDALLYRFENDRFMLVVNVANAEKAMGHLMARIKNYDCTLVNITADWAAIAVQGPKSKEVLASLSGGDSVTKLMKNAIKTMDFEDHLVHVVKTGYTGEPLGYEVYIKSEDAIWLWNRLIELGAKPAGLGARDTLRLEAGLPFYGHEMSVDPNDERIPAFAVSPAAQFAVSFSEQKGDYVGREALERQSAALKKILNRDFSGLDALPKRIMPIALLDGGAIKSGMPVCRNGEQIGWITSGTMIPYYRHECEDRSTRMLDEITKRPLGLAYIAGDVLTDDVVEVDVHGKLLKAVIPPCHMRVDEQSYVRPILYKPQKEISI